MEEKYLTLEQNTCAARIFLNTFGLTLGNTNDINEFSKIKVFDKAMNEVGLLHFDNGKVIISANYNNSVLEANFDIAKISSCVDSECKSAPFALSRQWFSKIDFQIQKSNNIKLSGEFLIDSSMDTEFGATCLCHPLINCEVPGKGKIILKILRDGSTFNLKITSEENYEIIDIRPEDWLNGFLLHDIKKGKYDEEKRAYPYRKYAGIFSGANKDKLHVFLNEEEYHNQLAFRNEFPTKAGDNNYKETLLQKGMLMQDLDPDMFEKIKKLKEVLSIGDISLLDNLISVCYDSYTDEILRALLGINRQKLNYQDGADNLVNSYFGIGKNSYFFPLEDQKKLLKK